MLNFFRMLISSTKKLFSRKFVVYACAGNDRTQMITNVTDDYGASTGCQYRIETKKNPPQVNLECLVVKR